MEALAGSSGIRGGTAGCSPVCLERNRRASASASASASARSRHRSLFVGQESHPSSRMEGLAMLHRTGASIRDYAARAHQSFADLSHAAFYNGPAAGQERSVKASENRQRITLEYVDDEDLQRQLGLLRFKLKRKGSKPSKQSAASSSSSSSSSESSDSEGEAGRRSLKKERGRQRSKAARDVSRSPISVLEDRKSVSVSEEDKEEGRQRSNTAPVAVLEEERNFIVNVTSPRGPPSSQDLPSLDGKEELGWQRPKVARDVSVNALPVLEDRRIVAPVSTLPLLDVRAGNPLDSYQVAGKVLDLAVQPTGATELQRLFNLPAKDVVAAPVLDTVAVKTKARVEVCVGGKCKKLGSENLLCAFQDNLSGCASVEAVSCKCLRRCQHGVNVRFSQEGGEGREVQSRVDIEDVHKLLRQHFPQVAATSPLRNELDAAPSPSE